MPGAPAVPALHPLLGDLRQAVDAGLAALAFPAEPRDLYDPTRYVLEGEGKRFRPLLVLLSARSFGAEVAAALPAALAVEVFHAFTLVHDDIMDRADTRRGRPTVHRRWNEPVAILTGDLLMGEAYRLVALSGASDVRPLLACFGQMVARLCEGQTLDMAFERQADVSVEAYRKMIGAKTGALLECALELGGRIGGAAESRIAALRAMGYHMGQAFQIQDDLLDLVADSDQWGKPVGGDLTEGKKTFLLLRALEVAAGEEHAWFARIVRDKGLSPAQVPEARRRMEALGVVEDARQAVATESQAALAQVGLLPPGPAADALRHLIASMAARLH